MLNEHTASWFLIQLRAIYANNVIRITGQILLFSGESAESGPAFGNPSTCVLSAEYTACVKLKAYFQGCQFRAVLLLHYRKNQNRTWYCERGCITSWRWVVHLPFENKIIAGQFLWDTTTLGMSEQGVLQTDKNQSQTIPPLMRNILSPKDECYIFFPFLSQFRPIPRASWRVDGSGSSCLSFQNNCLMSSSSLNKEYFWQAVLRLGIRKKLNVPKNWVGGQCFPAEPGKYSVLNTTLVKTLSFPSDLTVAAFPLSKDAVPWKGTNGKNTSIFKGTWTKWQTMHGRNLKPLPCVMCFVQECFDRWMHSDREVKEMNPVKVSWLFLFLTSQIFEWLKAEVCFYVWEAISNNKTVDRSFILFD